MLWLAYSTGRPNIDSRSAAIMLGASSPIARPGLVKLNERSSHTLHAVYVGAIVVALGVAWLLVAALLTAPPAADMNWYFTALLA